MLMRGIVVEEDLNREVLRDRPHHALEKHEELLMPMLRQALLSNDLERGEESGRAVSLLVVRHRARALPLHW